MTNPDYADQRVAQIAAEAAVETMLNSVPIIGERVKELVMHEFAGQRIPKRTAFKRAFRDRHICERAAAGCDINTLSIAFRLTPATIRRILKKT